jgi:hypothetical protein
MTQTGKRIDGEITFAYEKSANFRVISVDGAIGSIAPNQSSIHLSIYSERMPIPKSVTHVAIDGTLGPEIMEKRVGRTEIFREVEADLVLSLETAMSLAMWLNDRIRELQESRAISRPVGNL